MISRSAALLTCVLAVTTASCTSSKLEPDVPIGSQLQDGDRSDFVGGIISGSGGVMTESEAGCVADQMLGSDLTPNQLDELSSDLAGSGAQDLAASVEGCIEPDADVAVPMGGIAKAGFMNGLTASGWSESQAECILDGVAGRGFDARDFFVAGYDPTAVVGFEAAIGDVVASCELS